MVPRMGLVSILCLSIVDWRRQTNCQPHISDQSKVHSDDHSWTTACQSHQVLFSVHFSSVTQSSPTLYDPMDCSTPGLPVHHKFPKLPQIHVHRVGDAIHHSSSVIPFSSCLNSFPASGSFPRSQFLASGGQSAGASASASVLPMNIQNWFPLGWTGWISL